MAKKHKAMASLRDSVVVMPGALTPNEIFQAWKSGADVVKVFPGNLGGPDYLKTTREPLPQVELLPTKGVDFDTAAAYIKAGAIAELRPGDFKLVSFGANLTPMSGDASGRV